MSRRIRFNPWSIVIAIGVCLAAPASAIVITLEDFESYAVGATPTTSAGNVTVDDSSFGLGPYEGARQAILDTSGGSATTTVETSLGLANNRIQGIFNKDVRQPGFSVSKNKDVDVGSAFQITFSALAGDVLEFDWNMLSVEPDRGPPAALDVYTDFAWYDLSGTGTDDGALANVNDGSFSALGPTAYSAHTGQKTTQLTLASDGSYTITVGINDLADNTHSSALMIDFFRLVRGPEPGTFGTVAGGLMALSWLSRRRQRRD